MKIPHPVKTLLVALIAFSLLVFIFGFISNQGRPEAERSTLQGSPEVNFVLLLGRRSQAFLGLKRSTFALAESITDQLTVLADSDLYLPPQKEWEYKNISSPDLIKLQPGETKEISFTVKNIGRNSWPAENLKLGAIYHTGDYDRVSVFANESWETKNRIKTSTAKDRVSRGQTATFNFSITAPTENGFYREYLQPLIEYVTWISPKEGKLYLDILVGKEGIDIEIIDASIYRLSAAMKAESKEIIIDRPNQRILLKEHGQIVAQLPVSTGKVGYTTPAGIFRIINHIPCAYSYEYKLYMENWMAIKREGWKYQGHGMHALPYWRLKNGGKLYEGTDHLGRPVSHGCIRMGIYESKIVYDWAENETKVIII